MAADAVPAAGMRVGHVAAPVREQVLEIMRRAILDFRYKPGQRLIERELIEQIGVSRTTIREVLRALDAEGLVTTIPHRGVIVMVLSPGEAADLYEARTVLEELTARRFVERATDGQIARLRHACEAFAGVVADEGDIRELLATKDALYRVLLEGAGNSAVTAILAGLQARVRILRAASLSQPGRPAQALREVRRLVRAIERRDGDGAAQACVAHLRNASTSGLEAISADARG
jgi:DNA-binding GntR family transcriptional regulator